VSCSVVGEVGEFILFLIIYFVLLIPCKRYLKFRITGLQVTFWDKIGSVTLQHMLKSINQTTKFSNVFKVFIEKNISDTCLTAQIIFKSSNFMLYKKQKNNSFLPSE